MSYKNRTRDLETQIRWKRRELDRARVLEKKVRTKWSKGYHAYNKAVDQLADLKRVGTKKQAALRRQVKAWPQQSQDLTKERDATRARIETLDKELISLNSALSLLKDEERTQTGRMDGIVSEVFRLNRTVLEAVGEKRDYLAQNMFPRLVGDDGKLRSRITFTSSDGRRRVVILANTLTIVQPDLAAQAMQLIQSFFDRFKQVAGMDTGVKALYELTRQILVEKVQFKVGPVMYRFLAMELSRAAFPELVEAQELLRQSIRSERTTSYVRLYVRESATDKWKEVPQS